MAVPAINFTSQTTLLQQTQDALRALREARQRVLNMYAVLDLERDDGAVTTFLAGKLGAADATEAGKAFDEVASVKGYIESTDPNTFGAAVLQACSKFGV